MLDRFQNKKARKKNVKAEKSNPSNMCHEWLRHLVGMRVSVPERWWNGQSKSKTIYDGTVSAVHLGNSKESKCFRLSFFDCDDKEDVRYDVIREYVDKNDKDYENYYVPAKPVAPIKQKVRLYIDFTFICKIVTNIFLVFAHYMFCAKHN